MRPLTAAKGSAVAKASKTNKPKRPPFEADNSPNTLDLPGDVREWLAHGKAQGETLNAQLDKARAAIDHALAVRDGIVAPSPWEQKPKVGGRQAARIKAVLPEIFSPDGKVPDAMPLKTVHSRVKDAFAARGWKPASLDTVARAIGRRG
jgi:hypothetical protein